MPELLNALVVKPPAQATRRATAITSAVILAALVAVPVTWGIVALRSSPARQPIYGVLPAASGQVPMKPPGASPVPLDTPTPPAPDITTPAALPPTTRATPPSAPSSASHPVPTERRVSAPRPPADAAAARPPASRSDEDHDPGAVIDWLLESSRRRK